MWRTTGSWQVWAFGLLVATAFSGCFGGGEGDGDASPSPTTVTTPPAGGGSPREALNKSYAFQVQNRIPPDTMTADANWTTLEFTAQLFRTAQCSVLQNEAPTPPATQGAAPGVHFRSPAAQTTSLALGTVNECSQMGTTGPIGTLKRGSAGSEAGSWAVTFTGVGQGIQVRVIATGS